MKRYLELYPIWQQFLANYMGLEWNDWARFKEAATMEQDLEILKVTLCILYAMRSHILSLDNHTVAIGSMVCRFLEGLMSPLKLLSRGATHLKSGE